MLPFAIIAICFVMITLGCIAWESRRRAPFEARFPPISDAEFLARCAPLSDAEFMARCPAGTNPEIALKVRRIVAEQFGVDYERIHPDTRFVEDLGAD